MGKQLRLVDRLLLGAAFIDEFLNQTVGRGNRLRWRAYDKYRDYLDFWTPPDYQGAKLKQNIFRLLKAEYLEKRIINGEPRLVIASKGRLRVERKFSYFRLQNKKWDGNWRIVIFDIREKDRQLRGKLRRKLRELGFGLWQKSIYISPHGFETDMKEFLESANLFGRAYVFTARHHLLGEAKILAEQVWQIEKLNARYFKLETEIKELPGLNQETRLAAAKKICYAYGALLDTDPCLPKELLPDNWLRPKIAKEIVKLMENQ